MQAQSRREILAFSVLALSAFFWVSLVSHDPADFLLGPPDPARNACGPAGAYVSHAAILWVGKLGAYGLAAGSAALGLALFFRRAVAEPVWKLVGGALLVLSLASFEVALDSTVERDSLPGGYYGQFIHELLLENLSSFGMYLLLGLTVLVAVIISTDTVLYPALARAGGVALDTDRWEAIGKKASRVFSAATSFHSLPIPRIAWRRRSPPAVAAAPSARRGGGKAKPVEEGVTDVKTRRIPTPSGAATDAVLPVPEASAQGDIEADEAEAEVGGASSHAEPRPPLKIRVPEVREPLPRRKAPERKSGPYRLPPLDLIEVPAPSAASLDRTVLEQTAAKIEETLMHFKIDARVVEVQRGPTITQYEVSLAAGIKVHKIMNLADDLAMALKAPSIRIVAPIPGKSTVGIEVPNKTRSTVGLRELLESAEFRDEDYKLPLALGKDVAGTPVIGDLGEMPHLLIAGSTGSGKSVSINSIIINLLLTRTPDEVKLILVDPKMVELAQFENIPHLLTPVVTDMKKAPAVLGWTVDKMEERYELLALAGVRHILSYNALGREKLRERLQGKVDEAEIDEFPETLPFIVVIIDELADLMMTASKEVEASITRLSQKSRAVGIHVILATQRPSVDVITGLIKANMPSRVSFHVASKVDSRTILDRNGAEKLLGKGDLLYLPPGTSALVRVQGTFISDKEIRDVVKCVTQQAEPQFSPELTRFGVDGEGAGTEEDELYEEAVRTVLGSQRGSVTLLQRQLQIGYTRASRLMEIMHENGLVGPFKGSKAREVYYTLEEWEQANAKRVAARKAEEGSGEEEGVPTPQPRDGGGEPEDD
jgi:S-DNA-T family DNA segregation ATPase FtsK/SpoIIIE